jgi:hypothetical protein
MYALTNQPVLNVILTHGSHITSLRLGQLSLSESRPAAATAAAAAACTPKRLEWIGGEDIREWAHLPLHSVELLEVREVDEGDTKLAALPVSKAGNRLFAFPFQGANAAPEDLLGLLRQAATNLAGCPAWRASQPPPPIELFTSDARSAGTGAQLLRAVAPMMGGVTSVHISLDRLTLGGAEVEALGSSSSSTLTRLTIWEAYVQRSFWPAVWRHLPALRTLAITVEWCRLASETATDVALFCSRAPHPFTLLLSEDILAHVQSLPLMSSCRLWGTPEVTIRKATTAELVELV